MVQMRWYKTMEVSKKLQYRVKYDTTVRARMFSPLEELKTANYQWSEWMDVTEVWDVDAEN